MNLELVGRTALVTGASYGLGFGCAKILSQEGAHAGEDQCSVRLGRLEELRAE